MAIKNSLYKALMLHAEELRTLMGAQWPRFEAVLQKLRQALDDGDHDQATRLMDNLLTMGLDSPAAPLIKDLLGTVREKTSRSFQFDSDVTAFPEPKESETAEASRKDTDEAWSESREEEAIPKMKGIGDQKPPEAAERGVRPDFLFKLIGDGVYESSVLADTEASLVFYLGKPDRGTIARLKAAKLDKVLTSGGDLGVFIVPVGYTLTDENAYRKVVVANWEMPEVVFILKAGAVPNPQAGAWVYLYLNEILIYAFFLGLPVIEDPSQAKRLPAELPAIDLEATGVPTQASLFLTQDGDELLISYKNSKSGFSRTKILKELTLPKLDKILENVNNLAKEASVSQIWKAIPDPFLFQADEGLQRGLDESMKQVAKAGWELWISLTQDDLLQEILLDLDKLPPTSKIDLETDNVFLPWEIIYPENVNVLGLKPGLFWGARYLIQSTLQDKKDIAEEKRLHQACVPQAFIYINSAIDEDLNFSDLDPKPGASHEKLAIPKDLVLLLEKPAEMKQILLGKKEMKKWLYFFCHGRGGTNEALDLGGGQFVGPADLNQTVAFNCRPIVFLNSCSSGAYAPLLLNNFYTAFREYKKVLGLIGTSFPVPAVTAAAIGRRLTEEYLAGKKNLGTILFEIRRELVQNRVPIGLFYTLHCPADICALPGLPGE